MTRYPTPLSFDLSGTAVARFFGDDLALVEVHKRDDVRLILSACPTSIGVLGRVCSACPGTTERRRVALCWDVSRGKWCVLAGTTCLLSRIRRFSLGVVPHAGILSLGLGPDVVVQRMADSPPMVRVLEETVGVERGTGDPPPLGDFVRGMEAWSCFARK